MRQQKIQPERVMIYDACELEQQIKDIVKQYEENSRSDRKFDYREKKSRMKGTREGMDRKMIRKVTGCSSKELAVAARK